MRRRALLAALTTSVFCPAGVLAQRSKVYSLGYLAQRPTPFLVDPLVAALRKRGWILGSHFLLDVRATGPDLKRADEIAKELVAKRVDLLIVAGTHMAIAARRATGTIPIVMYVSGWPVEGGLVASYARPGGNITGLAIYGSDEMYTKFMSLIVELLPGARELGMIWDYVPPAFLEKEVELGIGSLKRAARQLKLNTRDWPIHTEKDLERALFEISTARPDALFATSGPVHGQPHNVTRINEFALRHRLPLVCDIAGSVFRGGGLLAYAASWDELAERCASFVDRILRGANPAELPIELPTRFELVINLKTAKSIGLAVPQSLLGRADRVIE